MSAKRICAIALTIQLVVSVLAPSKSVDCRELDAQFVTPVADTLKSVLSTVFTGVPLDIDFKTQDFARDLVFLTWQTGFPVTMPSGVRERAQQFYDELKQRVADSPVENVERKTMAALKVDIDNIIDAVVEEIRSSPDGIYTDLTQTQVNGVPLQDAMVSVGQQLKAYGVDLTNYKNIAQMVLGIPVLPSVASTFVGVTKQVPRFSMSALTGNLTSLTNTLPSVRGIRDRMRVPLPAISMASQK
ncbi:hypothetical protein GZH46_01153 [Fragariocoptes setiger]|uniref:Uncharacterized protein n=1 Tax=Fragariocoptes setiger TaxID=1670756 RepID=A0ABQ7SAA2_9ACAR|nr:hypothetical protein GZH46_01153 [Fragariocoptes setiger]